MAEKIMIDLDSRFKKNEEVPSRIIEGEAVLVNIPNGEVIHLNPSGAFIWGLIDGDRPAGRIAEQLSERYGICRQTAENDVLELLAGLLEKGVISCSGKEA
ncbi:MAG: PqqD family protein [Candidatus Omnitrophica bacterium]|nr:PqqD family protein [Candidatus Omnitrophota bacterium]